MPGHAFGEESSRLMRNYHKTKTVDFLCITREIEIVSDVAEEPEFFDSYAGSKPTAVGMILATLYAVSALLPLSGFFAAAGFTTSISFAIIMAPLIGVILGPYRGGAFGLIAGVLATFVSLPIGGGVYLAVPTTILGPAASGFFTGLARQTWTDVKGVKIPGPIITAAYLLIVVLLYEIQNLSAWWFVLPYMLAAVVSIAFQFYNKDIIRGSDEKPNPWAIALLAFIGTMTDFSMMTIGAVYILAIPADVFGFVIFPLMLVERSVATVVSSILLITVFSIFGQELLFGKEGSN